MTPAEVLQAAADRVQFGGWTQGTYARDATGDPVAAGSNRAVAWCIQGALKVASSDGSNDYRYGEALRALQRHLGTIHVTRWSDTPGRTAGEVADAMRQAAETLENEV